MSLFRATKDPKEAPKIKKPNKKKVLVKLPAKDCPLSNPTSSSKVGTVVHNRNRSPIHRSIMTEGLHGDHKDCCRLKIHPRPAFKGEMGDTKLPTCHYLMEQTFESFLLKLDDVFLSLKRDFYYDLSIDVDCYKDIYEKLRAEILIAMDKLEFLSIPKNALEQQMEFFNKMKGLKNKLAELRWQYHTAIKDLGFQAY